MKVGDICTRDVVTVVPESSIPEAARLMRERQSGSLVVIRDDQGKVFPAGILTDRDIVVKVVGKDVENIANVTAGELLDRDLVTATEDESLVDLVAKMRAHGVRRVPVVAEDGSLVGIVAYDDVIGAISGLVGDLAVLVGRQQKREEKRGG